MTHKPIVCAAINILEDRYSERPGFYRAYHAESPESNICVTFFGYFDSRGSHKTIKNCVAEVRLFDKETPIYRDGRCINNGTGEGKP